MLSLCTHAIHATNSLVEFILEAQLSETASVHGTSKFKPSVGFDGKQMLRRLRGLNMKYLSWNVMEM